MAKKIRIGNDIGIEWRIDITKPDGSIVDLSTLNLKVSLIVGSKEIEITQDDSLTIVGDIISFVFPGSRQTYTGSYVVKVSDAENTSITYDVCSAFILVNHSWESIDVISEPTSIEFSSVIAVERLIVSSGSKGDKGDPGEKGEKGENGAPAGFGTINATVDSQVGVPSVVVETSGPDTAKNITFKFYGLKGQDGQGGGGGGASDPTDFLGQLTYNGVTRTWIFGGNLLIEGNLSVSGDLTSSGDLNAMSDVNIGNDMSIDGDIVSEGNIDAVGHVVSESYITAGAANNS